MLSAGGVEVAPHPRAGAEAVAVHHTHTIAIIDIEKVLDTTDVTQTTLIVALECRRQVQVDSQQAKKEFTGLTIKRQSLLGDQVKVLVVTQEQVITIKE